MSPDISVKFEMFGATLMKRIQNENLFFEYLQIALVRQHIFGPEKKPWEVITWQKQPIKKALTSLSKEQDKEAVQVFKSSLLLSVLNSPRYTKFHWGTSLLKEEFQASPKNNQNRNECSNRTKR